MSHGSPEHIDVSNHGSGVAHNVQLVMHIPQAFIEIMPGMPLIAVPAFFPILADPPPVSQGFVFVWDLGDIGPGETVTVSFEIIPYVAGNFLVEITASCPEASVTINAPINLVR